MSNHREAPDWWQGTDGKWYPPVKPAETESSSNRPAWLIALGLLALIGWCSMSAVDQADDPPDAEDLRFGARDVCHQFVEDRLRAPATAGFENLSEAMITGFGPEYTVAGHVDAENGFGARIRTEYKCTVRHTTGPNFVLVSLQGV